MGRKLFKRLGITLTGIAMAIGVGVGLSQRGEYKEARAEPTTITKTTNELVSENGWTVSSGSTINDIITSIELDDNITISTTGEANCGSFWGTSTIDWRLYQAQSGNLIITADSGYELESATFSYSLSNGGSLYDGETAKASGSTISLSGTTKTLTVGSTTGKSNGQVKITQFSVTYSAVSTKKLSSIALSGTYPTSFTQGDTFSHEGMIVTATYDDESTANVTASATFTGQNLSNYGVQTVTVTYVENDVTKTATYSITVAQATMCTIGGTIANGSLSSTASVREGNALNITINADTNCTRPESLTLVTMGEDTLIAGSGYTYNNSTGAFSIASVTGNVVINATCIKNHGYFPEEAYSVAEAIAAVDAGTGVNGVYATGIVSRIVTAYDDGFKNITFDISDTGSTDGNQLRAYRCGGTSVSLIEAGDIVIVTGNLVYYDKDEIYEFSSGCTLNSRTEPTFTITYDDNGATGGNVPTDATAYNRHDDAEALGNAGSLVKTGYVFNGWNSNADPSAQGAQHYSVGDPIEDITSNITLYAEWLSTSPSITVAASCSGYTGEKINLEFTYGYIQDDSKINVTANNAKVQIGDVLVDDGEGVVEITFVTAGNDTVLSFNNDEDELATCTVTINQSTVSITGLPSTGDVYIGKTLNLGNKITVEKVGSYTTDVSWESDTPSVATVNENGVVSGVASGTAIITVTADSDDQVSQSCTVTVSKEPYNYEWDLSIDSTASASADSISWTSSFANMVDNKASATTAANNYYPGTQGHSYTSTRFYKDSILTISPIAPNSYIILSVEFTATTEGYAGALRNSTWTNASTSGTGTTVIVTPTDGTDDFYATISANCGFNNVKVYYEKTWGQEFLDSFTCSGATLEHPDGAITAENPTTVWSDLSDLFDDLSSAKKTAMKTNDTVNLTSVEIAALARYDLVIRKYGSGTYEDFIGRFSEGGANYNARGFATIITNESNNTIVAIVIIASVSTLAIGGYFFIRRRKER